LADSEALAWADHLLQDVGYENAMQVAADLEVFTGAFDARSDAMAAQASKMLREAILVTACRLRH
jgi:hypothetical protein